MKTVHLTAAALIALSFAGLTSCVTTTGGSPACCATKAKPGAACCTTKSAPGADCCETKKAPGVSKPGAAHHAAESKKP